MSTLLFWQGRGKGSNPSAPNGKNWIHAPDVLVKGHVAYLVKFLGSTQVDQPKGIEVVKDAIRRLQFSQQLKKSETKDSAKCKKVEITISVDGVAVQEPRTSNILHQFPLHRISYCADDKGAKKYFSFIAKGQPATNGVNGHDEHTNGTKEEQHECFVFVSTKLASEITLTIGQAFDLAYRRFLNDNGKYIEMQKLTLQNKKLELQVNSYKTRLQELSRITYKDDLNSYMSRNGLQDIAEFKVPPELAQQMASLTMSNGFGGVNGNKNSDLGLDLSSSNSESRDLLLGTPTPTHNGNPTPRALPQLPTSNHMSEFMGELTSSKNPVVGTKLEGLLLQSDSDSDFDPRACEEPPARAAPLFPEAPALTNGTSPPPPPPLLAPPPKTSKRQSSQQQNSQLSSPAVSHNGANDLFGSTPFSIPAPNPNPLSQSTVNNNAHNLQAFQNASTPNYDISDFNMTTSVFNSDTTSFTNGLAGYDPFETQKFGSGANIFGNGFGNNGNGFGGYGGLSEKQSVALDSSFSGFLDKRISEMKDGFSRGISFGNDDFSVENLDPLKKN